MRRPRVLMVTGAYHPEASGASRQCRLLIASLRDDGDFQVLTTTTDAGLPARDQVDGVPVWRVHVDPARPASKARAAVALTRAVLRLRREVDIVHLHGFSQKSVLMVTLAKALGWKLVLKLTSFGDDDPVTMRSCASFRWYARADAYLGVSPRFAESYREAGLPEGRFRLVPNGVDLQRFHPVAPGERVARRRSLGVSEADPLVLFVGFFSREKRPDVLYEAWRRLDDAGLRTTLVLVGATRGEYHEIDPALAAGIRADAAARGLEDRVVFVEQTEAIETFYQAADVFALPTTREGLPNVVLEAMASGVPPVVTRLRGVTDWLFEDGVHGRLVADQSVDAFSSALAGVLRDPSRGNAMGDSARRHAEAHFGMAAAAARTLAVYRELLAPARQDRHA